MNIIIKSIMVISSVSFSFAACAKSNPLSVQQFGRGLRLLPSELLRDEIGSYLKKPQYASPRPYKNPGDTIIVDIKKQYNHPLLDGKRVADMEVHGYDQPYKRGWTHPNPRFVDVYDNNHAPWSSSMPPVIVNPGRLDQEIASEHLKQAFPNHLYVYVQERINYPKGYEFKHVVLDPSGIKPLSTKAGNEIYITIDRDRQKTYADIVLEHKSRLSSRIDSPVRVATSPQASTRQIGESFVHERYPNDDKVHGRVKMIKEVRPHH